MHDTADYRIQFFRQWLGDSGIEDLPAGESLAQAKTLAQVHLESLARGGAGRGRPRVARIVDVQSRVVVTEYRLTQGGPVEISPRPAPGSKLRLVESSDTVSG